MARSIEIARSYGVPLHVRSAQGDTVWFAAATARTIAGQRAQVWTAAVTAALMSSPLLGVIPVNGELLSAPFIAAAVAAAARSIRSDLPRKRALWAAFGAGVLSVAALLVKQNMADGAVFACTLWGVAWVRGRVDRRDLRGLR